MMGVDLAYYWAHRCLHVYHLGWAAHSVHHSGEDYNLPTALRPRSFATTDDLDIFATPGPVFPSRINLGTFATEYFVSVFGSTPNFVAAWDGWNFSSTLPSTIECIIGHLETVTMLVYSSFGTDSSRHTALKLSAWITTAWRNQCEASTFGSSICSIGGRSREVHGAFTALACGDWSAHLLDTVT